ncbi:MAG: CarD family transcriptional regulator [Tissierellia bacterium]|nr:CarD family transcriptional regulator [Bacillota bacterium]NLL22937.1 CarD family transcriptional regulator [Tissierellia bacterium]
MKIGSRIVYPMHGAGIVIEIQEEDFYGENILFCTLKTCNKQMLLKFPLRRAEEMNIRKISDKETILNAMEKSEIEDYSAISNWSKRYQTSLDKMKIGTPEQMASVLVNLKLIDSSRGLSSGERQLYHNALEILSSELMLIEDLPYEDAFGVIENKLEEVIDCKNS